MKILIDTREQRLIDFPYDFVTECKIAKLDVGDYGAMYEDGYVAPVFFERKSIGDLFGTMGNGYARFKRELERAKELDVRLILIIEGTLSKVLLGAKHSTIEGVSVVRKLMTLWVKYGLTPVFCRDRVEMGRFMYEYFCSIGRIKRKKRNEPKPLQSNQGQRDSSTGRVKGGTFS